MFWRHTHSTEAIQDNGDAAALGCNLEALTNPAVLVDSTDEALRFDVSQSDNKLLCESLLQCPSRSHRLIIEEYTGKLETQPGWATRSWLM